MKKSLTGNDFRIASVDQPDQGTGDGGFATALIRKPEANSDDYNTVFYANIIVSVGLIFILYLTSGAIADFFRQPQLAQVLPAMSIILLFNACSLIQKTILVKQLDFKSQALVSFVSSTTSGIIGIAAAFHGFGVWSLALQQISRQFIMMVGLWIANHWIPAFRFSAKSFHELFPAVLNQPVYLPVHISSSF